MRKTEAIVKCRLSYVYILSPRKNEDGTLGKYSCTLIIDKNDKKSIAAVNQAIESAKNEDMAAGGKAKLANAKGVIPSNLRIPLRDGDESDKPEYENSWYINATAPGINNDTGAINKRPAVWNRRKERISDEKVAEEVYSGCYAYVKINMYPYSYNGNKGIAAGLRELQKIADGEPLGGFVADGSGFEDLGDDVDDTDFNFI